jgi:hypothetical protein
MNASQSGSENQNNNIIFDIFQALSRLKLSNLVAIRWRPGISRAASRKPSSAKRQVRQTSRLHRRLGRHPGIRTRGLRNRQCNNEKATLQCSSALFLHPCYSWLTYRPNQTIKHIPSILEHCSLYFEQDIQNGAVSAIHQFYLYCLVGEIGSKENYRLEIHVQQSPGPKLLRSCFICWWLQQPDTDSKHKLDSSTSNIHSKVEIQIAFSI